MPIPYCIFKLREKKPNAPFYMTYVRTSSMSFPLNWILREKVLFSKWYNGASDQFLRSFLLLISDNDLEIDIVENVEYDTDREVVELIKQKCHKTNSFNNFSYDKLETIFAKRLTRIKSLLVDKQRYQTALIEEINKDPKDVIELKNKLAEINNRIDQLERAINVQENFKTGNYEPRKKVVDAKFTSKTPFDMLSQSVKPYVPAYKKRPQY
jgi:hypothetical protein